MSTATNYWQEWQTASDAGPGLGRGTGMTMKEFNRRLTKLMRRKRILLSDWRWRRRRRRKRG
jgi:hypothetical protein